MNILDTLFGKRVTPAERLRQHQRTLQKAQRELDRERGKLEQQEKKLMADIKKSAKAGQMSAAKIQAKDLVRTRRYIQKFTQMRVQLQAVSLRMQALRSNEQMAVAMRGATKAMGQMNRSLNLPQIQRIMNEFEKESATMDMKEEMMSDAVDDVMDDEAEGEGEEEEGDKVLREVLDEIGVSMGQMLGETPDHALSAPSTLSNKQAVAEGLGADSGPPSGGLGKPSAGGASGGGGGAAMSDEDALQARLDQLRRD
ncbi:hypothetical protein QFC20_003920 [Naganishia adeliensis]|uniref:Uncharacterized protein n=1 Tax=Naganishia adeliensis TaxID=92952 RepID=A0ACC2W650_9TREE|nr:hypothetical protein QFC20_003920 [Naganishia adeliensis]